MAGAEGGFTVVPLQCIVAETVHSVLQIGDIGGVGRHIVIGGFQLRAVDGVGAASSQGAIGDIGDFAGGAGTVGGAEGGFTVVPLQCIIAETVYGVLQIGDIGGVGRHIVVGGFQL